MNLAKGSYSHEKVLEMLKSDSRNIGYKYSVLDKNDNTIGFLSVVENPKITFDSTREIMRAFSGTLKKSELLDINTIDERIVPWMVLKAPDGEDIMFPLGKYLLDVEKEYENGRMYLPVNGYDMTKIIYDTYTENRYILSRGDSYSSALAQIIGSLFKNYNVDASAYLTSASKEWEIGTSWLTVANDICNALNYYPVYCDEYGIPTVSKYIFPNQRETEIEYSVGKKSIILNTISQSSNRFGIPNKYVRYVESTDSDYMIATYSNMDASSPYSIPVRGRTICDVQSVSDIASQDELYNYTMRAAIAGTEVAEQVDFYTMNMPGHGFKNCISVKCEEAGLKDKCIEYAWEMDLSVGGTMLHRCNKVVTI